MKNWIIRTKNNFILGPVSREKLLEIVNSGTLAEDDELCSGNGYWFFFREKDLLKKYLIENNAQQFNMVSEAVNEKKIRETKENQNNELDDITVIVKSK